MKRQRSGDTVIKTLFREYQAHSVTGFVQQAIKDTEKIFLCEACLSQFSSLPDLIKHAEICTYRYWIPGDEIYRCDERKCVIMEIDGRKAVCSSFTRRIAYLSKFFLDEKTTLDDLHFFAFIVIFELDDYGYHFAGYFSKEWRKTLSCTNTLSCLMVLPPYRSKGYGSLLVELSYEMAKIEGIAGTPERPLSTGGKRIFSRIWREELLRAMFAIHKGRLPLTLRTISSKSAINIEDTALALHHLGVVFSAPDGTTFITVPQSAINESEKTKRLNNKLLLWVPLS
ncbi:acetyltransferase, putative [Trypanosoma equiperdum]|uniref:histone acetyltransferase n=1 Tax=Trypanosoma equiperdum TaxID=5694 RepID=A0A1G4ICZ6_TRYEQ|nr:acetyltransferase, putative [Trypanosoma equiperdum]